MKGSKSCTTATGFASFPPIPLMNKPLALLSDLINTKIRRFSFPFSETQTKFGTSDLFMGDNFLDLG